MQSQTNKKILQTRPIQNNVFTAMTVDVIIPIKNNHAQVVSLLDELINLKNVQMLVTLIDDNSESKTFLDQFKNVPWIQTHRFEEDKGFGYCVNHAVKMTKNDINFVLHSDVHTISRNAFQDMVKALIAGKEERLALVSAQTDNTVSKSLKFLQRNNASVTNEPYVLCDESQYVPLIFAAFSKAAFSKVGGLPTYPYCFFEDRLLCEKLRAFNYNCGYTDRVFVRHHGSKSVNYILNKNKKIKDILAENKKRYLEDSELLKSAVSNKKS